MLANMKLTLFLKSFIILSLIDIAGVSSLILALDVAKGLPNLFIKSKQILLLVSGIISPHN